MATSADHVAGSTSAHAPDLSETDRALIHLPDTRNLRQRLSALLSPYRLMVSALTGKVPSYVQVAVVNLLGALDRWERDEKDVMR